MPKPAHSLFWFAIVAHSVTRRASLRMENASTGFMFPSDRLSNHPRDRSGTRSAVVRYG